MKCLRCKCVLDYENEPLKFCDTCGNITGIEQEMLEKAFQAVGLDYEDLNQGDLKSKELESTHKISPVNSFKGYKRR